METSQTGRNIAVLVVHGVADTQQGNNLKTLVENLSKRADVGRKFVAERYDEIHWLSEISWVSGKPEPLPVIMRHASLDGARTTFAEVYWADTTRVKAGKLAALLAAFQLVFEAHYFVGALVAQGKNRASRLLAGLLHLAAAIIRGPIAAANIVLLTLATIYLYGEAVLRIAQKDGQSPPRLFSSPGPMKYGFLVICALLAAGSVYLLRRNRRLRDLAAMEVTLWGAVGAGLAIVALLFVFPTDPSGSVAQPNAAPAYAQLVFYALSLCWGTLCGLVIVASVVIVGMSVFSNGSEPTSSLWLAVALVIVQAGLWILFVSVPAMALLGLGKMAGLQLGQISNVVYGFATNTIGFLLVGGGVLQVARSRRRSSSEADLQRAAQEMPRLIINERIVGIIVVPALITMGLALLKLGSAPSNSSGGTPTLVAIGVALFVTFTSALLYFVLDSPSAVNFIHIARDLIDHHYRPKSDYVHHLLPQDRRWTQDYPRRERLLLRVCKVLDYLEPYDAVLFVAHSQGSVIVFEHLKAELSRDDRKTGVVTFGSPLSHLYEHYFHDYARIKETLRALRERSVSWTNLYRVDDPIGNEIANADCGIRNILMTTRGGHTGYWVEAKVADAIFNALDDLRGAEGAPIAPGPG